MSAKNLDGQGRWRRKNVCFMVSPEEAEMIDAYVKLSGLSKQDYLTAKALNKEINVVGNPKVYKALKDQLTQVYDELTRIESGENISKDLLDLIAMISEIVKGLREE